ncbi:MAG TPA: hypothetical protein VMP01_07020 [Pirellulaceae bacterium]|nr:hypothetical protein [Pirellulaceae bacterium]
MTIGVVQLLALWAATSTRPWLLRALLVWGAIVLLLPIRVMEPAAMLTMSAAWTMGITAAIARISSPGEESSRIRRLLRFGLADVIVLMLFLGTWLALVNRWLPPDYQLWYSALVAVATLPLAILSILAHRTVVGPRRMWTVLLTIGAIWICALLLRAQNAPLNLGEEGQSPVRRWLPHDEAHVAAQHGALPLLLAVCLSVAFIAWRAMRGTPVATRRRRHLLVIVSVPLAIAIPTAWLLYDAFATGPAHFRFRMLEIGNHCILLAVLAGFIALVTGLATASWSKSPNWTRHVARTASLVLAVVIGVPAVWIYWQLLWYTPFPQLKDRGLGHYERILEITKHHGEYATSRLPFPPTLRSELDEAVKLLRDWNDVPRQLVEPGLSSSRVVATGFEMADIAALARGFEEAAAQQPDADRAAEYAMANIRFGAMVDRTGAANYGAQGYYFLGQHRDDMSLEKAREITALLQQTLDERYPIETVEAWNRAQWERRGSWYQKLKQILAPYSRAVRVPPDWNSKVMLDYRKSWETINRLIQTHLAIRIYKSENGRLPTSLEELTPDILTELPLDPHSGRPLIYRPSDPTYELYSVGPDGKDNGGKLIRWMTQPDAKGVDLGLP